MPTSQLIYYATSMTFAAAGAFALSPLCIPLSELIGAVDLPLDGRRMHRRAVPRIGGLAVFTAFLTAAAAFFSGNDELVPLLGGGLAIILIGIADDACRVSPLQKLVFQFSGAAISILLGGDLWAYDPWKAAAALVWPVFLSNAFNLIDGLDGLCARVTAFSAISLFALGGSPLCLLLSGAMLGFLPYNLRGARLFLGDTGALFAGFSLGVLSLPLLIGAESARNVPALFLIFALPVADTASSFLRRALKGKNPLSPDRGHFHHRLVDGGLSHARASLLLSLISLALCSVGVAFGS